jgi:hypothetical protein
MRNIRRDSALEVQTRSKKWTRNRLGSVKRKDKGQSRLVEIIQKSNIEDRSSHQSKNMIEESHLVQVKSCEEVTVGGISHRKNWELEI